MNFTAQDVEKMIEQQRSFFYTRQTKDVEFRKKKLQHLKDSIKKYEAEVFDALKKDLNKGEFEAYSTEIGFVYESISLAIKNLDDWVKPETVKTPLQFQPGKSFIKRDPYGVVLIIAPFNYPFQLVMEPLIGAIVGGNTAIVKPSEATPHTTAVIKNIISETFGEKYVRVVEGSKEEVTALIHAPFDYIFFTGSVAVGKVIAKAAAERLTPVCLELGGKSPAIVDQTADIDVAVERIAWGKFSNAGQTCVAPDYILVHSSVYDKFVKKMKKTITRFYGKNIEESPDFCRIINTAQFDRLYQLLEKEAKNITFGGQTNRETLFIEPTIVENVSWENPIMEEEIFGPIMPIMKYDELPQIIHKIRQNPKPLSAYLFSEHEKAIEYFLEELPFGGGCINDVISHVGNMHLPFGGVGESGVKGYHGKWSYENFTHPKSILKRSSKLATDIVFPPYNNKVKLVRMIMK